MTQVVNRSSGLIRYTARRASLQRVHNPPNRPQTRSWPAFPLIRPYVVGATGFEPVTSSVSANTGNRCARRRSPRSPPTVDPQGKRSLDVKGNALFSNRLPTLGHHYITPSSCGYAADRSVETQAPSSRPARRRLQNPRPPLVCDVDSDTGSGHPLAALAAGEGGFAETLGYGHSLATRASSPSRCGSTSGRPRPQPAVVGEPLTVVGPAGDLRVAPGLVGDAGHGAATARTTGRRSWRWSRPRPRLRPSRPAQLDRPRGLRRRRQPGTGYWGAWIFR